MAGDTRWFHFGDWKARFASGIDHALSEPRVASSGTVRDRVAGIPNVRMLDGRSVRGLLGRSGARSRRVASARRASGRGRALDADLRRRRERSRLAHAALARGAGRPAPRETEVRVDVGYASRFYRRPERPGGDWLGLMIYPTPPGTRLGVLFPVEGDRWMVTLVGWFGDHPAGDDRELPRLRPQPRRSRSPRGDPRRRAALADRAPQIPVEPPPPLRTAARAAGRYRGRR